MRSQLQKAVESFRAGRPSEAVPQLQSVLDANLGPEDSFVAQNLLGICLTQLGDGAGAVYVLRRLLVKEPLSAEAHANLGMALRLLNRNEEALSEFKKAVRLSPERPQNHIQLGKQYELLSRWDLAVTAMEQALELHGDSTQVAEALAVAYAHQGRCKEAEAIFERIAPLAPNFAESYAIWLQEENRFEDSIEVLKRSIAERPQQGAAYLELAEAKCFEWDGVKLSERVAARLNENRIEPKARIRLCFALGKAYDHEGRYEEAMARFDEANQLAYRTSPSSLSFDAASAAAEPGIMAQIYSRELLEQYAHAGDPSSTPIFIVGMIRSGTTLLDQILGSHPEVDSAGERTFWNVEGDPLHRRWRDEGSKESDIQRLAAKYLELPDSAASEGRRVIDKMPINYRHLGLIHLAFPNAKLLHIRRNPLDTCLSIYMTFLRGGTSFAYKKANIVEFYRSYVRLMAHWRSVLPADRFLELDYENLVTHREALIRHVVKFCELPWDQACLSHHNRIGPVATHSRWQVRQPIYTSSIGRWRRYEPWLGELLGLIGLEHPSVVGCA